MQHYQFLPSRLVDENSKHISALCCISYKNLTGFYMQEQPSRGVYTNHTVAWVVYSKFAAFFQNIFF